MFPHEVRVSRPQIAARWWVDRAGQLRTGWPSPGGEGEARAMGWAALEVGVGVIEWARGGVDSALLDTLGARYPGRRWLEVEPGSGTLGRLAA